jgi:predicted permease
MASSRLQDRGVAERADANPFSAKTIIWVIVAGLLAFAGFLFLMAYAPKWDRSGNGGAHVLSKSAVGFSGLYALEKDWNGDDVTMIETKDDWYTKGLLIVPIEENMAPEALEALVRVRQASQMEGATTLYILPKWATQRDPKRRGWVNHMGTTGGAPINLVEVLGDVEVLEGSTDKGTRVTGLDGVDLPAPPNIRYISKGVTPILADSKNRAVLGMIDNEDTPAAFILADPDLLANHGLKSREGAAAAITIIEALRPDGEGDIAFLGRLAGGSDNRNLLQLMFEPPFLAFTLALIAAAILIGLHALGRFGPAAIEGRAIPFGKRALADNVATLVARAGREGRLGERYVAVVRDAAGAALGAGALAPEPLEKWLGTLPGGFTDLAYAARNAPDAASMRDAAAALFQWKKDVTRDH